MTNSIHYKIGGWIRGYIERIYDWLGGNHEQVKKLFPRQIFVYGVCGGGNLVFGWVLYWFIYNFVLQKSMLDLGFHAFKPHNAAFFIQFPITFLSGFWLNRHVSFAESDLKKRVQMPRYLAVVVLCIVINMVCLKLFVEIIGIYPTPSQIIATIITTVFSFVVQKKFVFKIKKEVLSK